MLSEIHGQFSLIMPILFICLAVAGAFSMTCLVRSVTLTDWDKWMHCKKAKSITVYGKVHMTSSQSSFLVFNEVESGGYRYLVWSYLRTP